MWKQIKDRQNEWAATGSAGGKILEKSTEKGILLFAKNGVEILFFLLRCSRLTDQ